MSWAVERDVRRGRDRFNLSQWDEYTLKQRKELLADIASAVKNGEMPLPQYTLIHRAAKLSDAQRELVYGWARTERRKLRSASWNCENINAAGIIHTTHRYCSMKENEIVSSN